MQSKAATVAQYLAELPAERRAVVESVRRLILDNLDRGFEERMQYGMIGYCVPHAIFPAGYHCDPAQTLPFAGLAAQKNAYSLYMMGLYGDAGLLRWFAAAWATTGRKLDMGKSCIRFKKVDDLAPDVIAEAFRRQTLAGFVAMYERSLDARTGGPAKARANSSTSRTPTASATTPKKSAKKPAKATSMKSAKKAAKTSTRRR
jgi:Domain of unknown function (DU1801)